MNLKAYMIGGYKTRHENPQTFFLLRCRICSGREISEKLKRNTKKRENFFLLLFIARFSPVCGGRKCSITPEVTGECKIYSNKLRASRKSVFNMINVVKKRKKLFISFVFSLFCLYNHILAWMMSSSCI